MKSTVDYLDAVKARLDLPSDYAAAKALGVTPSAVSKYRLGRAHFDDDICVRVAGILDIDVLQVIATVNYERARTESSRALWSGLLEKLSGVAVGVALAVGLVSDPLPANASNHAGERETVHYVKSRRRRRAMHALSMTLA